MAGMGVTLVAALLSLAGSEWGHGGAAHDGHADAFVQFGTDIVSGSGGCNRFSGSYTFDGAALAISQLAVTQMACVDNTVMERERDFIQMLLAARSAEATHLELVLKDGTGAVLATLQRRDWD